MIDHPKSHPETIRSIFNCGVMSDVVSGKLRSKIGYWPPKVKTVRSLRPRRCNIGPVRGYFQIPAIADSKKIRGYSVPQHKFVSSSSRLLSSLQMFFISVIFAGRKCQAKCGAKIGWAGGKPLDKKPFFIRIELLYLEHEADAFSWTCYPTFSRQVPGPCMKRKRPV